MKLNVEIKFAELTGWVGLFLIHGATLPTLVKVLVGDGAKLPELSFVLMVWCGLVCYLIRAISIQDRLHIVSNSIGFVANGLLMLLVIFN